MFYKACVVKNTVHNLLVKVNKVFHTRILHLGECNDLHIYFNEMVCFSPSSNKWNSYDVFCLLGSVWTHLNGMSITVWINWFSANIYRTISLFSCSGSRFYILILTNIYFSRISKNKTSSCNCKIRILFIDRCAQISEQMWNNARINI